jgi:hypothetical protein
VPGQEVTSIFCMKPAGRPIINFSSLAVDYGTLPKMWIALSLLKWPACSCAFLYEMYSIVQMNGNLLA